MSKITTTTMPTLDVYNAHSAATNSSWVIKADHLLIPERRTDWNLMCLPEHWFMGNILSFDVYALFMPPDNWTDYQTYYHVQPRQLNNFDTSYINPNQPYHILVKTLLAKGSRLFAFPDAEKSRVLLLVRP